MVFVFHEFSRGTSQRTGLIIINKTGVQSINQQNSITIAIFHCRFDIKWITLSDIRYHFSLGHRVIITIQEKLHLIIKKQTLDSLLDTFPDKFIYIPRLIKLMHTHDNLSAQRADVYYRNGITQLALRPS